MSSLITLDDLQEFVDPYEENLKEGTDNPDFGLVLKDGRGISCGPKWDLVTDSLVFMQPTYYAYDYNQDYTLSQDLLYENFYKRVLKHNLFSTFKDLPQDFSAKAFFKTCTDQRTLRAALIFASPDEFEQEIPESYEKYLTLLEKGLEPLPR